MTASNLAFQRLFNQRIAGGKFDQPEAVVRWMGAMQAQDYAQAVWAVGLRASSATLADVEQAISDRKIVRTWPMRGTIHFVPPENAKWMLNLSAARITTSNRRRHEQLNLDKTLLERCKKLFYDALNGDRRLSRPEMMALLESAGISTTGQRGYHILGYAALTGLICLGPMENKQQTFVLLDEWAPNAIQLSHEEALARLAGRYFASHGPATLRDFAWWAGLPIKAARAGLADAAEKLVSETIDGNEYWHSDEDPSHSSQDAADFFLLPGFDEYLLGYTDRGAVLAAEHAQKIVPGGNGVFRPILVAGGQVVGAWQRALKKNALEVTIHPFTHQAVPQERWIAAAQRYSDFLGLLLSATRIAASD